MRSVPLRHRPFHRDRIGLDEELCMESQELEINSRAFSRSPASAAEHISCISRASDVAVTEMIPLPPRSMSASPLASSPLLDHETLGRAAQQIRARSYCWR